MTTTLQALDYCSLWEQALPFDQFLAEATVNRELWHGVHHRAEAPAWARELAGGQGGRRWLVLAEDWCMDAVSTLPFLARLAESVDDVELRILRRDEHPQVMDAFLTNGTRSIPIVIVLDPWCSPLGAWGPRPAPLQQWVLAHPELDKQARTLETRRWYARDRGETTLREVLAVGAHATGPGFAVAEAVG